jgi:hypothetical protein
MPTDSHLLWKMTCVNTGWLIISTLLVSKTLSPIRIYFSLQQEGLGKSVKIFKHFARGKIKLVN